MSASSGIGQDRSKSRDRRSLLAPLVVFLLLTLGCSAASLVDPPTPTPIPLAVLAPTFTATPSEIESLIIITPPSDGQPGVIIIPPDMDPDLVIPLVPTAIQTATPTPTSTSTPSPTLTPTSTPTPLPVVIATAEETPAGAAASPLETPTPLVLEPPTPTPTPSATPAPVIELVPTDTPTPAPTATPTLTPTPYILVESGLVSLRTGPGVDFPLFAQLGPNIPVAIIGQHPDGRWYQICCISGEAAWVPAQHIQIINPSDSIPQVGGGDPPTPTATFTPTETATLTPTPTATPYPFERAIGPQFFPTNNEHLTLWVKLYVGTPPNEEPASDHHITVLFEGLERANALGPYPSLDEFQESAPPGSGNRVTHNFKYEYHPPDPRTEDPDSELTRLDLLGTGTWSVYVSDGLGNPLSDEVVFTTSPSNPNREVYIGWARVH